MTSGSTLEIGVIVNEIYASVIEAGTHLAPTIKVAEAAKVIENSQRDINIVFVNELKKIFDRMNIDTNAVLEAPSAQSGISSHANPGLWVGTVSESILTIWHRKHRNMAIILKLFWLVVV